MVEINDETFLHLTLTFWAIKGFCHYLLSFYDLNPDEGFSYYSSFKLDSTATRYGVSSHLSKAI
jgi:hypothetical protein